MYGIKQKRAHANNNNLINKYLSDKIHVSSIMYHVIFPSFFLVNVSLIAPYHLIKDDRKSITLINK